MGSATGEAVLPWTTWSQERGASDRPVGRCWECRPPNVSPQLGVSHQVVPRWEGLGEPGAPLTRCSSHSRLVTGPATSDRGGADRRGGVWR